MKMGLQEYNVKTAAEVCSLAFAYKKIIALN